MKRRKVLTAYGLARVELVCYLFVHQDGVHLVTSLCMPIVDSLLDPLLEGLADEGVDDVCHICSWQLLPFSQYHGKTLHHLRVDGGVAKQRIYRQAFEMRHRYHLDVRLLDSASFAGGQIGHVVDRHRLV